MTSFRYAFTQNNACGYAETYEIENMPAFVTHNAGSKDFNIQTDELNDVG